ncbi:hypothetical protein [Sphingomonas yantingensis]|uniref:Uncharacterized protein n=1 Tax=Sphingomonas yantingensis TaxID=1241761 RepID=A0A7W9EJH5_9SPHN|nr:hypothetical protein [Sphingomonas yantingensis]MBB5698611.1 hypothetical protein [Sphingomonas yantingensis]
MHDTPEDLYVDRSIRVVFFSQPVAARCRRLICGSDHARAVEAIVGRQEGCPR